MFGISSSDKSIVRVIASAPEDEKVATSAMSSCWSNKWLIMTVPVVCSGYSAEKEVGGDDTSVVKLQG